MNQLTKGSLGKSLNIGALVKGRGKERGSQGRLWAVLFKCRKGGIDFMIQASIAKDKDSETPLSLEVFNPSFFDFFSADREAVMQVLRKKILASLKGEASLPPEYAEVVEDCCSRDAAPLGGLFDPSPDILTPETSSGEADLDEIFKRINAEYFDNAVTATIRWGRESGATNSRSFRFGSYDHKSNEIRIHPRLKQSFVPRCVLELTVYHEMCHQWAPPKKINGRYSYHHNAFKKKEREFRDFDAAKAWEKQNWKQLFAPPEENRSVEAPA
ncbi:MAG: SprT family zinc-dependent metalloprotease [Candidatus Nitrohelix vancouverensis]|uniref:SprT family zinc-dependent metalloprotease n=1 Tax=Candidatus Nitrohelix vancouverensis TaxID=2705534 RepID=A0A7T0G4L4_9BACT|nr:MAG: SprT family zinc-dependent metalloprotease [Candidatus Nitrohelix vancouverensis]